MAATKSKRPDLAAISSGAELQNWYWLKAELLSFCQSQGLSTTGSKTDLTARAAHYIDTGEALKPAPRRSRPKGAFNWARDPITDQTIIDAGYTNGPNVRDYFTTSIGPRFRFNLAFMQWMKSNPGRTMSDAIDAWLAIEADRKAGIRSQIPASNQYNRYVRDFFDANPDAKMRDARAAWQMKRSKPGHNRYEPTDLDAISWAKSRD